MGETYPDRRRARSTLTTSTCVVKRFTLAGSRLPSDGCGGQTPDVDRRAPQRQRNTCASTREDRSRPPLQPVVFPGWVDTVLVHSAVVQWSSPAALLPAKRKRSVRERSKHLEPCAVRMVGPLCSFLVGEPDGLLRVRPHVQRGLRAGLSQAARTHMDDRNVSTVPGAGIWFQGIPAPVEHACLFCNQGGNRSCR